MKQVSKFNQFFDVSCIGELDNFTNNSVGVLKRVDDSLEKLAASTSTNCPFHLSMCVKDLKSTRHFYTNILGLQERRATKTSVHFDFYGCQLTFHEVPSYSAQNIQREVDAEDVPVPHFGVAISFEQFEKIKESLMANHIGFVRRPGLRFLNKGHEQHVMFVLDPSGHGIEIKSFTKAPQGTWA
jgi:extradiol dioxygenase family protein